MFRPAYLCVPPPLLLLLLQGCLAGPKEVLVAAVRYLGLCRKPKCPAAPTDAPLCCRPPSRAPLLLLMLLQPLLLLIDVLLLSWWWPRVAAISPRSSTTRANCSIGRGETMTLPPPRRVPPLRSPFTQQCTGAGAAIPAATSSHGVPVDAAGLPAALGCLYCLCLIPSHLLLLLLLLLLLAGLRLLLDRPGGR